MWISLSKLMQSLAEDLRRELYVDNLNRMSDHLLQDIGLRRDQIEVLRLRPARAAKQADWRIARPIVRRSLQGCG